MTARRREERERRLGQPWMREEGGDLAWRRKAKRGGDVLRRSGGSGTSFFLSLLSAPAVVFLFFFFLLIALCLHFWFVWLLPYFVAFSAAGVASPCLLLF